MNGVAGDAREPLPPDPGWRPALRGMPRFLIPFYRLREFRKARRGEEVPSIVALRGAFLGSAMEPLTLLTLLLVIFPSDDPPSLSTDIVGTIVLGFGLVGVGAALWFHRRPLECAQPRDLASVYARLLFVKIAFAEAAALWGFVGTFMAEALWPYLLGLGLGALGFVLIAPTADDLKQRDEQLASRQCPHSLRRALFPSIDAA